MSEAEQRANPLSHSIDDVARAGNYPETPQTASPSHRLAFTDRDFLLREELRPVRLQLELLKPQMLMDEAGIESTVVMFGGARIPAPGQMARAGKPALADLSHYYDEARQFAQLMTRRSVAAGGRTDVICTGGGPGVMEAGNLGAQEAGGRSVGFGITLPHEPVPNSYVTPELSFNFHYFAIRKMHFLMRARAITVFPGGFGTLDELFETLTLIQTGHMKPVPVLLFGRDFWKRIVNWQALVEAGTIAEDDLKLFRYAETAQEAVAIIDGWDEAD